MAEPGVVVFRVSARGAGRTNRRLSALGREIQQELSQELVELGDAATEILQEWAPKGVTGRLERGITAVPRLGHARLKIEVHSLAEDQGFNYTRVSRFGHRRFTIYPQKGKALRINWDKIYPVPRTTKSVKPNVSFRAWVSAYDPGGDWVESALPELEAEAEFAMGRIERAIDTRLLR